MLDAEGKNIDGVMVTVPDHWHTHMALEAMQRGKHVYCEKPLARTLAEVRLLADAALKYKVATQMGNQGFNHEGTKTACEIFWSGEIGEVREVHSWTGGGAGDRKYPASGPPEQPVPAGLDWNMWLGPAAPRPTTPITGAGAPSSISRPEARWETGLFTALARRIWRCVSIWPLRSALKPSTWSRRTSSGGP